MTKDLFREWFDECFLPEIKEYTEKENIPNKILLLLDNASSHIEITHPNVTFIFLPPNTTSLLQPLDQGIISVFKKFFVKQAFRFILDKVECNEGMTVTEAWRSFTVKNCINFIDVACSALKRTTLNGCWKQIWPQCVGNCNSQCTTPELDDQVLSLGRTVVGGNFSNDDLVELIKEESLGDEELFDEVNGMNDFEVHEADVSEENQMVFKPEKLADGIQRAESLCNFFIDNDPYIEQAVMFRNEISACMARYIELQKSMATQPQQAVKVDNQTPAPMNPLPSGDPMDLGKTT